MEPQTRPIGCSGSRLYRAPGVVGIVLWTKLKRTMWVVPYCLVMVSSLASIGPLAALHCEVTYPQNNEQSLFVHKWANMRGILSQRINQKSRYGWTHDDDGAGKLEHLKTWFSGMRLRLITFLVAINIFSANPFKLKIKSTKHRPNSEKFSNRLYFKVVIREPQWLCFEVCFVCFWNSDTFWRLV